MPFEAANDKTTANISYRLGDAWAPALAEKEALGQMVGEFAAAIRGGRAARTDGDAGLRVLRVLESASRSLADGGRLTTVEPVGSATAEPVAVPA